MTGPPLIRFARLCRQNPCQQLASHCDGRHYDCLGGCFVPLLNKMKALKSLDFGELKEHPAAICARGRVRERREPFTAPVVGGTGRGSDSYNRGEGQDQDLERIHMMNTLTLYPLSVVTTCSSVFSLSGRLNLDRGPGLFPSLKQCQCGNNGPGSGKDSIIYYNVLYYTILDYTRLG